MFISDRESSSLIALWLSVPVQCLLLLRLVDGDREVFSCILSCTCFLSLPTTHSEVELFQQKLRAERKAELNARARPQTSSATLFRSSSEAGFDFPESPAVLASPAPVGIRCGATSGTGGCEGMALLGRQVLLEYDVGGPRIWHERTPLEHLEGDVDVILTPDGDVYSEELGPLNADVRSIRVRPAAGGLPAGMRPASIYAMPVWSANELANFRDEARRVADQERRAAGGVAPPPVLQVQAPAQPGVMVGDYAAGTMKWLAAEAKGSYVYGQEVAGIGHAMVRGSKAVHQTGDGPMFVECVDGADLAMFRQRPARCDIRLLPSFLNSLGQPERTLKDVAAASVEAPVGWVLSGPRTSKWCVNYLTVENLGFEGHHERLRQITKADASSWGIQEHFQISMSLRQCLLVDQVNPYNLLSVEIQFRRLQTIEFSYSEKAREAESRAVGGRLSLEEQTTFGGITRQYATLMICPDLLDFVKQETEKEASLAKNLRKARDYGSGLLVEPQESASRSCDRDVFPLQLLQEFGSSTGSLSRKCRQRAGRRKHLVQECNHTISALNRMYGRPSSSDFFGGPSEKLPSLAQSRVSEFVLQATKSLGSPPDLSGPEALCALRVSEGYEQLPSSSPLGAYDPAKVSLPAEGMHPVPLASLWGSGGQQQVEHFSQQHLLEPDLVQQRLAASGVRRCYQDPQFNSTETYVGFLKKLHSLGLIEFSAQPSVEQVGIFFVKKKGDRLRMILDCRRSNCHFSDPDPIQLATGEAMGRIQLDKDEVLYTASADLQNAFYTMEMPEQLRPFFGLRRVQAKQMSMQELHGNPIDPDSWLYPVVRVIPMGWSWAMWWCQTLAERICERSGLTSHERLRDHAPAPSGPLWHIQYVDNLHVFGTNKSEVEQRFWRAVEALRSAGLVVHEIEVSDNDAEVLGWNITSDGKLKPKAARLWKLRLAIREILRRGRVSGQQLERLVGHITFVSLCRREALSVLGDSYTFIRRHYAQVVPLWKSVRKFRKELLNWDGIAPLIFCQLDADWGNTLYAVDASEWGLGVTTTNIDVLEAKGLWAYNERWRFKHGVANNPRQYVQLEEELLAYDDQAVNMDLRQFSGVGFSSVDRSWKMVGRVAWRRKESMPVYEARATLFAIRHALRSSASFGRRFIILTDSLAAAVSFDKGRASSYRLRRVVEQVAALTLCTGSGFRSRWIPSEWNPSDGPSRSAWSPSAPKRRFWDDTSATPGSSDMDTEQPKKEETASSRANRGTTSHGTKATDMGHRDVQCRKFKEETDASKQKDKEGSGRTIAQPCPGLCECSDSEEVPRALGKAGFMVPSADGRWDCKSGPGHHPHQVPGSAVPGRCRSECSQLHGGSGSVPCSFSQGAVAAHTTVAEGMEKVVSSEGKDANTLRSSLHVERGSSTAEQCGGSPSNPIGLPALSSTQRAVQTASPGHCPSNESGGQNLPPLLHLAASTRGRNSLEDIAVGRDDEPGFETHAVFGASIDEAFAVRSKEQNLESLQDLHGRCQQVHGGQLAAAGVAEFGVPSNVPVETRGSFVRGSQPVSRPAVNPGSRALANVEELEELREGRAASLVVHGPSSRGQNKSRRSKKGHLKAFLKPALLKEGLLQFAVFLEIFSGCGRLGHSVREHCNWPVLLWDVTYGLAYDLTVRVNRQKIIHWITSGKVKAGHLGTPCNSFSRARDRPGGPPPLRSDKQPLGLSPLRPADAAKVKVILNMQESAWLESIDPGRFPEEAECPLLRGIETTLRGAGRVVSATSLSGHDSFQLRPVTAINPRERVSAEGSYTLRLSGAKTLATGAKWSKHSNRFPEAAKINVQKSTDCAPMLWADFPV
eukprot:Skav231798  [mRNA]  locus=scaffold734:131220:155475:+ [translate_table: standard]